MSPVGGIALQLVGSNWGFDLQKLAILFVTVCYFVMIFVRPFVQRFALCYRTVVLSVLSVCLSVCLRRWYTVAKRLDGSR